MIDKKTINQRIAIFIGICIIIIYFIPIILLGKDSYILIWDYLDGHLPRIKTVVDNGILFLPFSIIPIMGGLSRSSFSPPNLDIIIQSYLPEFWSIVVLVFIIKLTAFIGLFFLLKDHLLINNRQSIFVALFTSVLFALVPFHPVGGISSAGIPLLLYSFLNLMKNKGSFINWLIIIYYGFFSSLVLSGVFICFSLGVLLAVSWIRNKHLPLSAFWGLLLLCIVYGVTNYNLISDFFHADVGQSHREEFVSDASWLTVINKTKFLLLNSQGHCGSFPAWIIILLSVLSLFIRTDKSMLQLFIVLLIILVSVFIISNSLNIIFPNSKLINSFQIDRFYFLYPALCFILLGVALSYWLDNYPVITVVFCLILGTQILKNDALLTNNIRFLMGDKTPVSYREFFDKQLFDSIKDEIDYSSDTDKVVCVGFYPSIAEYNGFYTLDGYANMYPLSYKHLFKQVIQQELDKSEWLNNYFTKWGNRCYIFSAELKDRDNMYMSSKEEHYPINQLDIDTEILKQLGCRYIFSAVDIDNFDSINLDYIDCFTTDESYWAIRVYRL